MGKMGHFILKWGVGAPVYFFPYWFGTVWVAGMTGLGTAKLAGAEHGAITGLLIAGAVMYAVMAVITLAVMLIGMYRHCCIDMNTLRVHLRHAEKQSYGITLFVALAWPYGWPWFSQRLVPMEWFEFVVESLETWWGAVRNQGKVPIEIFPDPRYDDQRDTPLN